MKLIPFIETRLAAILPSIRILNPFLTDPRLCLWRHERSRPPWGWHSGLDQTNRTRLPGM